MACPQCEMVVDAVKGEKLEQDAEDARTGHFKFEITVDMLPEERAAVEGDQRTVDEIIAAKVDKPTPVPPTAAYVFKKDPDDDRTPIRTLIADSNITALERRRLRLEQQLTDLAHHKDGRNVLVVSSQKQLEAVM